VLLCSSLGIYVRDADQISGVHRIGVVDFGFRLARIWGLD